MAGGERIGAELAHAKQNRQTYVSDCAPYIHCLTAADTIMTRFGI